ncbi:hypothetical protein HanIR_Chr02g0086271 [Helianthus annuus]|nr:hypothetical protein HanIR_Chr02g0086271 [Helianthus annuus]
MNNIDLGTEVYFYCFFFFYKLTPCNYRIVLNNIVTCTCVNFYGFRFQNYFNYTTLSTLVNEY